MADITAQYPEIPSASELLTHARLAGSASNELQLRDVVKALVELAETLERKAATDADAAVQYLTLTETRTCDQRPSFLSAIVHCVIDGMVRGRVGHLTIDDEEPLLGSLAILVDACNMLLQSAAINKRSQLMRKFIAAGNKDDGSSVMCDASWESTLDESVFGPRAFFAKRKAHMRIGPALMLVRLGFARHLFPLLSFRDHLADSLAPSKGNKTVFHHMASAQYASDDECLATMLFVAKARLGRSLFEERESPPTLAQVTQEDLSLLKTAGLCSSTNVERYSALAMATVHNNATYARVLLTLYPEFAGMVDVEQRTPLIQLAYHCCKHSGARARQELARVLVLGGVDPMAVDSAGASLAELHHGHRRQLGPLVDMVNATMRVRARNSILANAYIEEKLRFGDSRSAYGPTRSAARAFTHITIPTLSKPAHTFCEKSLAVDYSWLWACTDPYDTMLENIQSNLTSEVGKRESEVRDCDETEEADEQEEDEASEDATMRPVLSAARRALEVDREALKLVQEARAARLLEQDSRPNVLDRFKFVDGSERPMNGVECMGSGMQVGDDTYIFTVQFQCLAGTLPPPSIIQMRLRLIDASTHVRAQLDDAVASRAPSNSPDCATASLSETVAEDETPALSEIHAAIAEALGVDDVVVDDNDTDTDVEDADDSDAREPGSTPLPPLKLPPGEFASLESAFNTLPEHRQLRGSYVTVECDWASLLFASGAYSEQLSRMIEGVPKDNEQAYAEGVHHVIPLENCDPAELAYFHRRHVNYDNAGEFVRSVIPDDVHREYEVACAYQFNLVPSLMGTESESRAAFRSLKRNLTADAAVSVAQSVVDGTVDKSIDDAGNDDSVPLDEALTRLRGVGPVAPTKEEEPSMNDLIKRRMSEWEERINKSIATEDGKDPTTEGGVATVGGEPVDGFLWFMFPNLTMTFTFRRRTSCAPAPSRDDSEEAEEEVTAADKENDEPQDPMDTEAGVDA